MIRYALTHRSRYDYSAPAHHARHLLHLLPRSLGRQQVVMAMLDITPLPDQRIDEQDYFGNSLISVECLAAHQFFETLLDAQILIEPWTETLVVAQARNPLALDALRARAFGDPALVEFLQPTALTEADAALRALGAASLMDGAMPAAGVTALMQQIYSAFSYEQGVTTSATTARAAFARLAGVCQDYAHVMIAALRACGVPARYVSGYLRSASDLVVPDGSRGAEQTHAWVSVWLGPALGWRDFDPTNNVIVDCDHVILALGRDYADISPVRGVILGGGAHTPHVSVSLRRMMDDYMPPG
jgi:transglutaminase-like putative cysteine protease